MEFRIEADVFDIYPELHIGVMTFRGIDNKINWDDQLMVDTCRAVEVNHKDLKELHPHVQTYKEAMKLFKKKKGMKCSIEAMVTRIKKGHVFSSINPMVDIYNATSLTHLITCGGEDLTCIQDYMTLGFAKGEESFIGLGESENKPPQIGELIYKDKLGAVVRGWLWREADRTKITEASKDVLIYLEILEANRKWELEAAMNRIETMVLEKLGGKSTKTIISKELPVCLFDR